MVNEAGFPHAYNPAAFHRDNNYAATFSGSGLNTEQQSMFESHRVAESFHNFDASAAKTSDSDRQNMCNINADGTVNSACQDVGGFPAMSMAAGGTEASPSDGRRSIVNDNLTEGDAERASLMFQQQLQQQQQGVGLSRQTSVETSSNFLYSASTPNSTHAENGSGVGGEKQNDLNSHQFSATGQHSQTRSSEENAFFNAGENMTNSAMYLQHHSFQPGSYDVSKYDAFPDAYKEQASFYGNAMYPSMASNFNASFVGQDGNQRMMPHVGAHAWGGYNHEGNTPPGYGGSYGNHAYGQNEDMYGMAQNGEMFNGYYSNEQQMVTM